MIYETQAQFTIIDNKGNDRNIKEKYFVENATTFGDAEQQCYEYCNGQTELDVVAVKRSRIKEIVNTRTNENERIFIAELQDVFTTDDGEEKTIKYKVMLFADTIATANAIITEYLKQGYNMELIGMKITDFKDLIK